MTARHPHVPSLQDAKDAYLVRFGEGAPVWAFLGNAGLPDAMLEAIGRGQLWTMESLGKRLSVPQLPARFLPMTLALADAVDRYWQRFRETPAMTILAHADDEPTLIAAMDAAIERGRPMTQTEVSVIAGVEDGGTDPDPRNPRCI